MTFFLAAFGFICISVGIFLGSYFEKYGSLIPKPSWLLDFYRSERNLLRPRVQNHSDHRQLVQMPPRHGDYTDYSGPFMKPILGTTNHKTSGAILSLVAPNLKSISPENTHTREIANGITARIGSNLKYKDPDFRLNNISQALFTSKDSEINEHSPRFEWIKNEDRRLTDLFDIVILTGNGSLAASNNGRHESAVWMEFLNTWKFMLHGMHVIVIHQGDPYRFLEMPPWLDYDLFNKIDVEKCLGEYSWLVDMESETTTAKTFGYMVSDRDFLYFLDRNVLPATDLSTGQLINPLDEHVINLLSPSTPYYFNTLYDPFRPGSDFSRGYPTSLREGMVTAISHGPVLNEPHYDSTTKYMKPSELDNRRPDVVLTIPNSVLYSLNCANVAVNRRIVGPIFLFPSFLRSHLYDIGDKNIDILVGWISKVVLDNVLAGVKHGGKGYVIYSDSHTKPHTELAEDLTWANQHEEIVRFFNSVTLSPKNKDSSGGSLMELTGLMDSTLSKINPIFSTLAKALRAYNHVYNKQHAFHPEMLPVASRSSIGPLPSSAHKCAVFTIMHAEPEMLPLWIRYYNRHFPNSLFVVQHMMNASNHKPSENGTVDLINEDPDFAAIAPGINLTHYKLYGDPYGYPVNFLSHSAGVYQGKLFRAGYKCVLYTDVDEFIVPDPNKFPGGLTEYLVKFSKDNSRLHARANGFTVAHVSESEDSSPPLEGPMKWNEPILNQREYWTRYTKYDKPLLSKVPVRWKPGFHNTYLPAIGHDPDLFLLHFTEVDKTFCARKEKQKYETIKLAHPEETGAGFNHHIAQYPSLLAKGIICRYAQSVFLKSRNQVTDKTGSIGLGKMDPIWKNVII